MKILMAEHTHYDSLFQVGCHAIARELVKKGHQVTYVSACLTPFHLTQLVGPKTTEVQKRFANWRSGGQVLSDNLFTYVPFSLIPYVRHPLFDHPWAAAKYVQWTLPSLRRKLEARGPYDLLLIGEPRFIPLLDWVKAKVRLLRMTDNVLEFAGTPRSVAGLLARAASECDRVIVTARPLVKMMEEKFQARNVVYVPNGVDWDRFSRSGPEPEDLKAIPRPRAVYLGALESWFDEELVFYLATRSPQVSFVIIGPPGRDLSKIKSLPNVHLLGPRPPRSVPDYLSACDLGLIPFKKTALIESVSPIKLYEYMACGLPVLSTAWEELRRLGSPAHLAEDQGSFLAQFKSVLDSPPSRRSLQDFARANSWESRADAILKLAGEGRS